MTFNLQAAREICIKLSLRYPARALIVDDYQCALASEMLPAALDRIAELEAALVEERKSKLQLDASRFGMSIPEEIADAKSREQLHAEGKI